MTDTLNPVTTHDLGQGWHANVTRDNGAESMTIRNPDKGQRIDLSAESVARLRAILAKAQ